MSLSTSGILNLSGRRLSSFDAGWRGTLPLDESQLAVVESEPTSRLIVSAGPGAGKTRTLLARARWLETRGNVAPGTEMILLSFSRAAVEVIAERSDDQGGLGALPVRTFDSFATRILADAGKSVDNLDYEKRIESAITELRSEESPLPIVDLLTHILVDESQDIVGTRAEFVLALIERACSDRTCGFTMFGDVAQGIYGFGLNGHETRDLAALVKGNVPGVESRSLTTNHRTQDPEIELNIERVGNQLRSAGDDEGEQLWQELHDDIFHHADMGWKDYSDAVRVVRGELGLLRGGRMAILCRTNVEVLQIGSLLQLSGVDTQVQHRAEDGGAAPWLAEAFGRANSMSVEIDNAIDRTKATRFAAPHDAARRLRNAGVASGGSVALVSLAASIRLGRCPEILRTDGRSSVTVSTIHRAKGLEFDTVLVVHPRRVPEGDFLDEAKTLFVAMSRAKKALLACSPVEFEGRTGRDAKSARSTVRTWGARASLRQLEVRVSDTDADWIPSDPGSYELMQERVRNEYRAGDEITLVLRKANDEVPTYDVIHVSGSEGPMIVGSTRREFGEDISRLYGGKLPVRFEGLTAELPGTASMMEPNAMKVGLPPHGLHLSPRFFGLGKAIHSEGAQDVG